MAPGRRGHRSGQGGGRGKGSGICRDFQRQGNCRFGAQCRFSHESESSQPRNRPAQTPQEEYARDEYFSWKRLIKSAPRENDFVNMANLWNGALKILNGEDRHWKQMLPRDLDDAEFYGQEHILALMGMRAQPSGFQPFITLTKPFILVVTHQALLDCLSVDTFVGNLYNCISGSQGTRAIAFFKHVVEQLLQCHTHFSYPIADCKKMLVATTIALREIFRREQRATFHDGIPKLLNMLQDANEVTSLSDDSVANQTVSAGVANLRAAFARLVQSKPASEGMTTACITSTYPRELVVPGGRYDNDRRDITDIQILPTELEIRSDKPDFMPTCDFDQPHFLSDQAERHLDTQFRLLRQDVFGELKDALRGLMLNLVDNPDLLERSRLDLGNVRAYCYPIAFISYLYCRERRGLEAQVSFNQLPNLRKKSAVERTRWWDDSKRLEKGAFLCFVSRIDDGYRLLFLTVSEKSTDSRKDYTLCSHDHLSTITTRLATDTQDDLELLIKLSCRSSRGVLIEFPGVLQATFSPVLENLQNMQRLSRLPFRNWILPDRVSTNIQHADLPNMPPALYARDPEFVYSLSSILKAADNPIFVNPRTCIGDFDLIDEIQVRTGLDHGQCQALLAVLGREFAMIQGPPGTGKSFLGVKLLKVLLSSAKAAGLGPIMVVCFTNHALDQFLEHIVKDGVEKVIRIGSQSQSTILEGKNLRVVSRGEAKTGNERYLLAKNYDALKSHESLIKHALSRLSRLSKSWHAKIEWKDLEKHLERKYPMIHSQFSQLDDDGFQAIGRHPFDSWRDYRLDQEPQNDLGIHQLLENSKQNIHSILPGDRIRLVESWSDELRADDTDRLFELIREVRKLRKQLDNIHDEVDRRILQDAEVIGVTTTGLDRISVLRHITSKITLVEEAGEVMEPHVLSALLPSVEHFIQIGDHQQLRPTINNYELSIESQQGSQYQLDRSQFERLSIGGPGRRSFPLAQLNVQRRMRPEISTLIRETIYPRLVDHNTVKDLPDVVGMRENVYWLDHRNFEEVAGADRQQKSHSNLWEVDMTHALVRHLVRQGIYSSSDIAVLTPYTGQLQKLRAKMWDDFEIVLSERDEETLVKDGYHDDKAVGQAGPSMSASGDRKAVEKKKLSEFLKVATVDNFQGEEAQCIIVSLVRSNNNQKVGFLRTTNRINVLLSRAQHGLYLIGNKDTYSNVSMWAKVLGMLEATSSIGNALDLRCPRHNDTELLAAEPIDFERLAPEGGCQLPCDQRLHCGHMCSAKCHSDKMHEVFNCQQPCERLHEICLHSCQKETCGQDCGRCQINLDGILLPCGHSKDVVPCYQTQDLGSIHCDAPTVKCVPNCGHSIEVKCSRDVMSENFRCPTACLELLPCGHQCPGSCGGCHEQNSDDQPKVQHRSCSKICGRQFGTCSHTCPRPCHDGKDCGPCSAPCEVRCSHSQCTLKCYQPCAPCVEACRWACQHQEACALPCAAPCSRLPCNERCKETLTCGHRCSGICGETCSEGYCHECKEKQEDRVDLVELKCYGEIDVDKTPIVILGCGHFYTAQTLDGLMGMNHLYTTDKDGKFTALRDTSGELAGAIPRCPDCKHPFRQFATQRYNRVVNRAVIDEMSKRFLVSGQADLRRLELEITEFERGLEAARSQILLCVQQAKTHYSADLTPVNVQEIAKLLKTQYERARNLLKSIKKIQSSVADKSQPAQKLHEATLNAARRLNPSLEQGLAQMRITDSVPEISRDRRVIMGGWMAQLKAENAILDDRFRIFQSLGTTTAEAAINLPWAAPDKDARSYLRVCKKFIGDCSTEQLPRFAVEASLLFAGIARLYESYCQSVEKDVDKASARVKEAKEHLVAAEELCKKPFQGADNLRKAVEESIRLLRKQWYEEVTAEEMAAIKAAMVGGSRGLATHSGHWYNCVNGHPFAIGECGMPMQQARCPECGMPIGGQNHEAVEGVTRATEMED